jgi:long-chain fatty acid transport protein
MTKFALKAALLAAPLAFGLAGTAQAGGFYLQEQSVEGAGRAFAGMGATTGTDAMWFNPASIGGMTGFAGNLGFSAILPKGNVNNVGTAIIRPGQAPAAVGGNQSSHNPINNGVLPSGGIAYGLNDRIAVGLMVTSPFSFETQYDAASWARYTADETRLRTIDLQPTVAIRLGHGLNIGGAINVEHSSAVLSNYLPNLSPLLPDGHQQLTGKGWNVGYSLGAQLHEGPLSLGLSYKSSIKHTLDGTVVTSGLISVPGVPLAAGNGTVATTASFRTPWQLILAGRLTVLPSLTLDAQVVRVGWGKFNAISLGAPLNVALPENYRNTWTIAGGVDYAILPMLTVRAGVQHDQTPTQDGQRDARVPDSNRWYYTAGATLSATSHLKIDAAAGYIAFKDASIDRTTAAFAGTQVQTPILVNGRLQSAHAVVLSLGGRVAF